MVRKIIHNRISKFDTITRFRLINAFFVSIGLSLFWPLAVILKGIYLIPAVIAGFMILETIMIKTNGYMIEKFNIRDMFKFSVVIHITFTLCSLIYFISPFHMILIDSFLGIVDVVVFSAYSIMLTNYLTKYYPEDMNGFQLVRNSIWADGTLIGLGAVSLITYFSTIGVGIVVFACYNSLFVIWLIKNWNIYDDFIDKEFN